jgi:pimeloyl-ACP methyl ester carboxylesterase
MKGDFDYSKEVSRIQVPTMVVAGDADIFPPSHAVEMFGLLGGGKRDGGWDGSGRSNARLAILPGLTHYTIFNAPALAATVIPFLDEPSQDR